MGKRMMLSDANYDGSSVWIDRFYFRDLDDACLDGAKVQEHSL